MFDSFKDFETIIIALFIVMSVIYTVANNFVLIVQAVLVILVISILSNLISGIIGD